MDGQTPRWADILAMAQTAESIGFDGLWISDHVGFGDPDGDWSGAWESWTLLSALAASTSRVTLGNYVLAVSFRNPALLAKMAETLDEISGGRVILGLGAGWNEPEYTSYGVPFDDRFKRFEDAIRIITDMLRHGSSTHDGRDDPDPQSPGSAARPATERVARAGRGERPAHAPPDGRARRSVEWRPARPRRSTRDAQGHGRRLPCGRAGPCDDLALGGSVGSDDPGAGRGPGRGTRDARRPGVDRRAACADLAGFGFDHLQVQLRPNSLEGVEAFAPVIERLRRPVGDGVGRAKLESKWTDRS